MSDPVILERRGIQLTMAGNLFMASLGIGFSLYINSEAILLDGVFSSINFVIALVSLRVARLVQQPDDDVYPFGYVIYEPVLNMAKGLLILLVALFALVSAVNAVLQGGRALAAETAVIYALIAAGGCFVLTFILKRTAKKSGSPIVAVDAKNWLIDGSISGAVAAAFFAVTLMKGSPYEACIPYADPAVVILLVIGVISMPIGIIRENWNQIMGKAPGNDIQTEARQIIDDVLEDVQHRDRYLRIGKMGRLVYVQCYLEFDPAQGKMPDIQEQDRIRNIFYKRLKEAFPHPAMDLIFTADTVWARRAITPTQPAL